MTTTVQLARRTLPGLPPRRSPFGMERQIGRGTDQDLPGPQTLSTCRFKVGSRVNPAFSYRGELLIKSD
jgi:hypothetical protein